ncbi:hypothetical protein ON010_g8642 [Phytophthora cinnamomi]|nr:hypothetical protein ON010_g8642 [Phytophthora cinnamomi]
MPRRCTGAVGARGPDVVLLEHLQVRVLVLPARLDALGQQLVVERVEGLVRRLDVHQHVSVRDAQLRQRLLVGQLLALVQQQDEVVGRVAGGALLNLCLWYLMVRQVSARVAFVPVAAEQRGRGCCGAEAPRRCVRQHVGELAGLDSAGKELILALVQNLDAVVRHGQPPHEGQVGRAGVVVRADLLLYLRRDVAHERRQRPVAALG